MTECQQCGSTENIDEHHTSYEPEKTVNLCRSCHRMVHEADDHELQPDDSPKYSTIRVSKETKQKAADSKHEKESWSDFILRCTDEPPEVVEFVDASEVGVDVQDALRTVEERTGRIERMLEERR